VNKKISAAQYVWIIILKYPNYD